MSHFCVKGAIMLLVLTLVLTATPLQGFASGTSRTDANPAPPIAPVVEEEPEIIDTAAPVLTPKEEEAKKAAKPADPRLNILNSAELNPTSPQSEDLQILVDDILGNIITDDMDTFQQTKACYDYIVKNTTYGSHISRLGTQIGNTTCRQITNAYGEVEGYGGVVLSTGTGLCNAYAAAFILLAREVGLDAYLVRGTTRRAGGGFTYHEWAEVNIDGNIYVFDPQLEQNLTAAGLGVYNTFCKTYDQVGHRYRKI